MVDFNKVHSADATMNVFEELNIDQMRLFISHMLYAYRFTNNIDERPLMYHHEPEITFKDRDRHFGVDIVDGGIVVLKYKTRMLAKFDCDFTNVILYPFDTHSFKKDDKYTLGELKKSLCGFSSWIHENEKDKQVANFFKISHLYPSLTTMLQVRAREKHYNIRDKFQPVQNLVINANYVQDNNWYTEMYTKNKSPYFFLDLDDDFIDALLKYKRPYSELQTKLSFIATHYDKIYLNISERTLTFAECRRIFSFFKTITEYTDFKFVFSKCSFIDGTQRFVYNKDKNMDHLVNKLVVLQKQLFKGFYFDTEVK